MKEYHKIQTLFKRDLNAPGKPMIEGDWTTPELEYLANNEWEFTEKVDGTNIRIERTWAEDRSFWYDINFGGRTDNAQIPTKLFSYLQKTFTDSLFDKAGLERVTLYGEGYGAGIQKGGGNYNPNEQKFVLFDVVVHSEDRDWWLSRDNVDDIAAKMDIDSVPVLGYGTLHDAIDIVKNGLPSTWGDFEAEGIVARPKVFLTDRKGERIITKIKGRDFK